MCKYPNKLKEMYEKHQRERGFVCCPEDCWCWDYQALLDQTAQLRVTVAWYGEEARAIAENTKAKKYDAVLSSVTVLALDAGKRAEIVGKLNGKD